MKKSFILFVFLLCSIVVVAQKKSITGIITDTAGEAVIGASIVEVGTTNGTVSDVDGNFTLSVSDNASIQVSFIGFSSQTLSVQGKMNFKIILKEDSELLQEVVVTGYGGKVSRAKLTNSISTVSPQILEKGIYTNPSQALSGSVPGLKVSLTSGNPTSSPKVILRGGTEFDGSGGPLVIVDGQLRDVEVEKARSVDALFGERIVIADGVDLRAGIFRQRSDARHGLLPAQGQIPARNVQACQQQVRRACRLCQVDHGADIALAHGCRRTCAC